MDHLLYLIFRCDGKFGDLNTPLVAPPTCRPCWNCLRGALVHRTWSNEFRIGFKMRLIWWSSSFFTLNRLHQFSWNGRLRWSSQAVDTKKKGKKLFSANIGAKLLLQFSCLPPLLKPATSTSIRRIKANYICVVLKTASCINTKFWDDLPDNFFNGLFFLVLP